MDISNQSILKQVEDWGHAEITPRENIPAASYGTWTIVYTAGANGIAVGGGLRILTPAGGRLHWELGKVTAYAENGGAALEVTTDKVHPRSVHHSHYPSVTVQVYGRRIEAGERLFVVLGDTGGYNSGRFVHTRASDFAYSNRFQVFVDPVGNARFQMEKHELERYHHVEGELTVETVAARPRVFRVSAHHPPAEGKPVGITLTAEDDYENPVRDFCGTAKLAATATLDGLPEAVEFTAADEGHVYFECPAPQIDGPIYITAYDGDHQVIGQSNPLWPGFHGEWGTYFGDLHVMTGQGGNEGMLGDTASALRYARDDRGLDFSAVTNSGYDAWDIEGLVFAEYNEPHRFVTMPAREFGHRSGHKNVYVLDDSYGVPRPGTWTELWEELRGKQAMVISHHTNTHSETDPHVAWGAQNLDTINPQFERVIEICQNRGSFEKEEIGEDNIYFGGFGSSVQSALAKGLRLGFVGGTDNHRGRPASGRSHQSGLHYDEYVTGGLTCVLGGELTREAVFAAIWERRCYATTGVRALLDFSVNGHVMGQEFTADEAARAGRSIAVRAAGTAEILRAVIVRNGEDVHACKGDGRLLEFVWEDAAPLVDVTTDEGGAYYYVRLVQADGNIAWSSPVWIDL